jgi:phospholipid/cholesterol/gamma-HCH transport system permease protein
LEEKFRPLSLDSLEIDASQLSFCGGIGMSLLRYLDLGGMTPNAKVIVRGLNDELQRLFLAFGAEDYAAFQATPMLRERPIASLGRSAVGAMAEIRELMIFVGRVAYAMLRAVGSWRKFRWPEVARVFEEAGADALPIVSLISGLVGLITALEAAEPLAKFGAQIFIADMVGYGGVRELGPLLAAIMVAGRSGSAFAAEIGTMKVNEELDAMATMGLDPVRFLVVQRLVAGVILMPLLSVYAMLMSVVGGTAVMLSLGFTLPVILHQIANRVQLHDLALGLSKGVVFGLIIAAVGCWRGLETGEGSIAVGISTTRAVVTSIVVIVLADAAFAAAGFLLHP